MPNLRLQEFIIIIIDIEVHYKHIQYKNVGWVAFGGWNIVNIIN